MYPVLKADRAYFSTDTSLALPYISPPGLLLRRHPLRGACSQVMHADALYASLWPVARLLLPPDALLGGGLREGTPEIMLGSPPLQRYENPLLFSLLSFSISLFLYFSISLYLSLDSPLLSVFRAGGPLHLQLPDLGLLQERTVVRERMGSIKQGCMCMGCLSLKTDACANIWKPFDPELMLLPLHVILLGPNLTGINASQF